MVLAWGTLPQRVIKLFPLATLGLVAALIAWVLIGDARVKLREALIERARIETPWAAEFLKNAPPEWVPMPWQAEERDLIGMVAAAATYNARLLMGADINDVKLVSQFAVLATQWHAQSLLCQAAPQGDTRFQGGCKMVKGDLLPQPWRTHFLRRFATNHYLAMSDDGNVSAGKRLNVNSSVCNAAPYRV
jgi:hypothetical protein